MNYTEAQRRAIDSDAKKILVVAGPGSGKTGTTVHRIHRLVRDGVHPSSMVAFTFTNAAADEVQKRLGAVRLGYCGTIHGFALRMLKQYGGPMGFGDRIAIVNEEATAALLESKAQSLGCKKSVEQLLKIKSELNVANKRLTATEVKQRTGLEGLVLRSYYEDLREAGLVDFDSILVEFYRLLTRDRGDILPVPAVFGCGYGERFTHLFVDEVQDSSAIDWNIFEELPMANKFFVGDTDQSIYAFRGGAPHLMLAYGSRNDVEVHKLEANFRSHEEICAAAQALIEHSACRFVKETRSMKGIGGEVTVLPACSNAGHEVARVLEVLKRPDSMVEVWDVAVLSRTNAVAREMREGLKAAGVPVVEPPTPTMPMDWKKCRALVDLLVNPENDTLAAFYLRFDRPLKAVHAAALGARAAGVELNRYMPDELGFGKVDLAVLPSVLSREYISNESRMLVAEKIKLLPPGATVLDLSLRLAENDTPAPEKSEGVTCTTIHGAKGREWDVVFLVGFENEVIPGTKEDELEEMRRLAYVGVTRARKQVFISWAESRKTDWGVVFGTPSRFIKEMLAG